MAIACGLRSMMALSAMSTALSCFAGRLGSACATPRTSGRSGSTTRHERSYGLMVLIPRPSFCTAITSRLRLRRRTPSHLPSAGPPDRSERRAQQYRRPRSDPPRQRGHRAPGGRLTLEPGADGRSALAEANPPAAVNSRKCVIALIIRRSLVRVQAGPSFKNKLSPTRPTSLSRRSRFQLVVDLLCLLEDLRLCLVLEAIEDTRGE